MHSDFRLVINPEDVESLNFDWGKVRFTLSPEVNSATQFSAGVVSVEPQSGHARHNHPEAEEIIHIISGVGEQMIEDESGAPVVRLEQTPIKLDHALEWRLRLSAQAKGCLGNPQFSAFGCCSSPGRLDRVHPQESLPFNEEYLG